MTATSHPIARLTRATFAVGQWYGHFTGPRSEQSLRQARDEPSETAQKLRD